jgi:hypothetical protein
MTVEPGGQQQQNASGETERSVEGRRAAQMLDTDRHRPGDARDRERQKSEPVESATNSALSRREDLIACGGDDEDSEGRYRQREEEVERVQAKHRLQPVGELARAKQRSPDNRQHDAKRGLPLS